jgi:hypothetical protein
MSLGRAGQRDCLAWVYFLFGLIGRNFEPGSMAGSRWIIHL